MKSFFSQAIRKQLKLGARETRPEFFLVGKDGGEKARCQDALDLDKWFAFIDAKPMRRMEIQNRKNSK